MTDPQAGAVRAKEMLLKECQGQKRPSKSSEAPQNSIEVAPRPSSSLCKVPGVETRGYAAQRRNEIPLGMLEDVRVQIDFFFVSEQLIFDCYRRRLTVPRLLHRELCLDEDNATKKVRMTTRKPRGYHEV